MKNYSSKTRVNSRPNSKRGVYARITIGIVVALVVLYLFGGVLGMLFSYVTTPMYVLRSWFLESTATIPSYLRERNGLLSEIANLRQELAAHDGIDATLARMKKDNEELRSLLSVNDAPRIAAYVVARPPYLPYDAILIDRGLNDGIAEHAIVYHANDKAIGFVSKVFRTSSLVTLFSTPGAIATAYIIGPDIYTTAYGEGGGVMRISVPQGIPIHVDDVVVLPSLEVGILGVVKDVVSVSTQPEQHAYVVQDVPIQSLGEVAVSTRVFESITYEKAEAILKGQSYAALHIDVPEDVIVDAEFGTSTAASSSRPRSE